MCHVHCKWPDMASVGWRVCHQLAARGIWLYNYTLVCMYQHDLTEGFSCTLANFNIMCFTIKQHLWEWRKGGGEEGLRINNYTTSNQRELLKAMSVPLREHARTLDKSNNWELPVLDLLNQVYFLYIFIWTFLKNIYSTHSLTNQKKIPTNIVIYFN